MNIVILDISIFRVDIHLISLFCLDSSFLLSLTFNLTLFSFNFLIFLFILVVRINWFSQLSRKHQAWESLKVKKRDKTIQPFLHYFVLSIFFSYFLFSDFFSFSYLHYLFHFIFFYFPFYFILFLFFQPVSLLLLLSLWKH